MTVYLDHNAAAPLRPAAAAAVAAAMGLIGNPSSVHDHGRRARRLLEDARTAVALSAGARPADVVFTGSGTEACQLALRIGGRTRLLASASEHAAVLQAPAGARLLPLNGDGILDLAALEAALGADARDAIVAVMLANNETGTVQPVRKIAEIVHRAGGALVVDAAQAYGKLALDLNELGADAVAVSAAKIGGPLGVGAAIFRLGVAPQGLIVGGGQERGLRGGSENLIGIAGFGAAASEIDASIADQPRLKQLRDRMERAILMIDAEAVAIGGAGPRLANTAAIPMHGVEAATQVMAFDLAGYAVSAGAACSSGKVAASHVLQAMGLPSPTVAATIRISLGLTTTAADTAGFVEAWRTLYNRKRQ